MRILVTGATGFIGQHLVERLIKEKHTIYAVVRRKPNDYLVKKFQGKGVTIIFSDVKRLNKINLPTKIDWIFHLAALVDVTNQYSYKSLYKENVLPTQFLIRKYQGKIKHFVYLSSMAAMGIRNCNQAVNENTKCIPDSNYGKSKLETEKLLNKMFQKEAFPATIIRPPTVYGPGEHHNFIKLAKAIKQKKFWIIGTGENCLSWCYVDNLVEAMLLVVKSDKAIGETYLVDDGRPYSLKLIAQKIAQAEGVNLPALKIPLLSAYFVGFCFDLITKIIHFNPPLSTSRVKTLTTNFVFNTSKIKSTVGYKAKITFSDAVCKTIASFEELKPPEEQNKNINSNLEREIIRASYKEGLGSIYERIVVKRFFEKLCRRLKFDSVLEYKGLEITKGMDNITFLLSEKKTTLINDGIKKIKKDWIFNKKPIFLEKINTRQKYDFVWNFATVQLLPGVLGEMAALSRRYVFVIVPNIFNWGTLIHLGYHFIFQKKCLHPERGNTVIRTPWGLKRVFKKNNLKILEGGYIDSPLLPDIGFSINELKKTMGLKTKKIHLDRTNIDLIINKLHLLGALEYKTLPGIIRLPFAHHLYILGERK